MITITTSQTNIPVKATADTLSASEFNELNSKFNLAAADLETTANAILNVDNTSDMDKPVSTLQEARIYPVESALEDTQIAVLNAQTDANLAITNAAIADGKADAAQNAADGAQTRADDAYDLAGYAVGKAFEATTIGGTFDTELPPAPQVYKTYTFAGVTNTSFGGFTWMAGDTAIWNGFSWTRVPGVPTGPAGSDAISLADVTFPPFNFASGPMGQVIKFNGFLYAMQRNGTNNFGKYEIATGIFTALAPLPFTAETSGGVGFDGVRYIYTLKGGTSYTTAVQFACYDIQTNVWTLKASSAITKAGVQMGLGNGVNKIFYLYYGKILTASSDSQFYLTTYPTPKVYIDGVLKVNVTDYVRDTDTGMITFTVAPAINAVITSDWTLGCVMGGSGAMPFFSNYLYVLLADDTPIAIKYDIAGDAWEFIQDVPLYGDWGVMCNDIIQLGDQHYIYTLRGEDESNVDQADFWRFNLITQAWETRAPMPVATDSGVLTRVGNNWILGSPGKNSNLRYMYYIPTNQWSAIAVSTIAPLRGTFNVNKSQIGNDGYTAVQYLVNDGVTPALTATWIKFLD